MRYAHSVDSLPGLITLFEKLFRYLCAKKGLITSEEPFYDIELTRICEQELVLVENYIETIWLNVFKEETLEKMITVSEETIEEFTVLKLGQVTPLVSIAKDLVVCLFTTLRSIISYLFSIKEAEKAPSNFIRNLLKSFGLYENFLLLPVPIQRKLARVLVHLYKYKGSKYCVETLMKILSFTDSEVRELFSYRLNSVNRNASYDNNRENLWFEMFYRTEDGTVHSLQLPYRQVIDKRWYLTVPQYGKLFVR